MPNPWPAASYGDWSETCDTLHAHTQVLGKLAATTAPPEPEFLQAALRLTARGWETAPLPAPDDSGAFVLALDLHSHEAIAEHSDGRSRRVALTPHRSVGEVTREVLGAVGDLVGSIDFDPSPDEVHWSVRLDQDEEHSRYEPAEVSSYFGAAIRASQVLAAFRAPYRGRSTPVNAWWGSFDLAVSLFSGPRDEPPGGDSTVEMAFGWWPGDPRYPKAAFYSYARPAAAGFEQGEINPAAARWHDELGEYILDWDEVRAGEDPQGMALDFARSAFRHARESGGWDEALAADAEGRPPPEG
ncbi:MAG TPA: DUF5996 family protein [Solirubrobacterales bacterium]